MKDRTTKKNNFSLSKLQVKFFINTLVKVQCKVLESINNNLLLLETEVDVWYINKTIKYCVIQLINNDTLNKNQIVDKVLDKVNLKIISSSLQIYLC